MKRYDISLHIDRVNKKIRKLEKLKKRLDFYTSIQNEICMALESISFRDWWSFTSNSTPTDWNQLLSLIESPNLQIAYNGTYDIIYQILHSILEAIKIEFGEEILESMITEILEEDNAILKDYMNETSPQRVSFKYCQDAQRLCVWLSYKPWTIQKPSNINSILEESKKSDTASKAEEATPLEESCDSLNKLNEIELFNQGTISEEISTFNTSSINLRYILSELSGIDEFNERSLSCVEAYISDMISSIQPIVDFLTGLLPLLWKLLNTFIIPAPQKKQIITILSNSQFKVYYQKNYDIFRMSFPKAYPYNIYHGDCYRPNIILPLDFNKGEKSDISMGLKFTHEQVVCLYLRLINDGYIDEKTDILNLAIALTGHPISHQSLFTPVNWVNASKQSLAIFLGLLRPAKQKGNWYWNKASTLFLYDGRTVTAKQLSTPFGKFLNHPETRGKDWRTLSGMLSNLIEHN